MARKVFISVLGTGLYRECKYERDNFCSSSTLFIQQATLEYYKNQKDWSSDSIAYILLTKSARNNNWNKNIKERKDPVKKETVPYKGLEAILDGMNLPFAYTDVDIPDGGTEDEMWQIFTKTFDLLSDDDELYLDLTHSFRYLPMLMLVLGNYAKFLKRIKVAGITYGNYEARNKEINIAPIVDLLPLSALQDWTFATADFLKNGYTDRLVELSKNKLSVIKRYQADKRSDAGILSSYIKCLDELMNERIICRGLDVVKANKSVELITRFQKIENEVIPPLTPVLKKSLSVAETFTKEGIKNMFLAAQWCNGYHLYQQAGTFLEEGVISFFCSRHHLDINDEDNRRIITIAFNFKGGKKDLSEFRGNVNNKRQLAIIMNDVLLSDKELVGCVNAIINDRNDFNHCGIRKNPLSSSDMRRHLGKYIPLIIDKLYGEEKQLSDVPKNLIFLNLSNHPSSQWDNKQLAAAQEYGDIQDMSFPEVSPESDSQSIQELALTFADKIIDMAKDAKVTVHVMGEMTFTYAVVSRLKCQGIRCVASTTERCVEENENSKTSVFKFVRFREY